MDKPICWECEWAAGKDGKCPWASRFEPVPGWNATPTTVKLTKTSRSDTFEVHDCPLFEIMHEIKENLVNNSCKKERPLLWSKKEIIETIEYLYYEIKMPIETVAKFVEYSEDRVKKILEERRTKP